MSNIQSENVQNIIKYDEIKQYLSPKYHCPPEAIHRLFEYILHETLHTIYRSAVDLENQEPVYFKEGEEEKILDKNIKTQLTDWCNVETSRYLYF